MYKNNENKLLSVIKLKRNENIKENVISLIGTVSYILANE